MTTEAGELREFLWKREHGYCPRGPRTTGAVGAVATCEVCGAQVELVSGVVGGSAGVLFPAHRPGGKAP